MKFDILSNQIIRCAIEVHKSLGPGLLESTYEECLSYELKQNKITHETQPSLPVKYKNILLDCGYRIDILVDNKIIIELKSVEKLMPIHTAQLLTYMKLSNIKIGLLMNFNVMRLKDGMKRLVL